MLIFFTYYFLFDIPLLHFADNAIYKLLYIALQFERPRTPAKRENATASNFGQPDVYYILYVRLKLSF